MISSHETHETRTLIETAHQEKDRALAYDTASRRDDGQRKLFATCLVPGQNPKTANLNLIADLTAFRALVKASPE